MIYQLIKTVSMALVFCCFFKNTTLYSSHIPPEEAIKMELNALKEKNAYPPGFFNTVAHACGHRAVTQESAPLLWNMVDRLARAYDMRTPACSLFVGNRFSGNSPSKNMFLVMTTSLFLYGGGLYALGTALGEYTTRLLNVSRDNATLLISSIWMGIYTFSSTMVMRLLTAQRFNAAAMSILPCCGHINLGISLCKHLSPEQLEAVIAHELAHIKNNDLPKCMLLASAILLIFPWILNKIAQYTAPDWYTKQRMLFCGIALPADDGSGNYEETFSTQSPTFSIGDMTHTFVAGITTLITLLAHSRFCERRADRDAASIINDPKALAQALTELSGNDEEKVSWFKYLFLTHPPIQERCTALHQIAEHI